jgi:Tfp pilus assembly protein PilN
MRAINLLPRDDTRRRPQRPQWVVVVPVIVAVLLSGALSILFLNASGKVKDKQTALTQLKDELAAIPTLSRRVAWDRVFRELSLVLPDDVWLSTLAAKAPMASSVATVPAVASGTAVAATEFSLDGYTYSHAAVARLLSRLAVVPDLVNVQLQQSTLTKVGTAQVVHFVIVADVRTPGGS